MDESLESKIMSKPAETFLLAILEKSRGKRTLTVYCDDETEIWEISKTGTIGRSLADRKRLLKVLSLGFISIAGVILREFTEIKAERVLPNGRTVWFPRKNVYGFIIMSGAVRCLSKNETRDYSFTSQENTEYHCRETDVSYKGPLF